MKTTLLVALLAATSFTSSAMTLTSQDIQEGSRMANTFAYNGFGCTGDNLSPQLSWNDAPEGTKSFAITAFDPDAPTGSGWWHWVALDVPASKHSVKRGASGDIKGAKEMSNDYGATGFGGACPPKGHGMHRYQFTVWALPTETLGLPEKPSNALIGYMLNSSALEKATLTATFVTE
ncbi:kinase inhibitor [Enterovibrio norvegicus]|uniref:YbhB/YbcL family Raf kinase inhibitor-like protein n=1 Tax=Enterovibrio norvegicus TaxID=188144 RepID=UPI0002E5348B|nr:YbhB/YbcL family Raf kinase inhibitor-like protein [Enterovibrio norvegicus]OEF52450.1 kinase inhibitor [Enterovibrio norvegicus]PMH65776.1 kinase inhibitor [Enterovibrio norvegicus]